MFVTFGDVISRWDALKWRWSSGFRLSTKLHGCACQEMPQLDRARLGDWDVCNQARMNANLIIPITLMTCAVAFML
jgi:hypothetical protein